MDKKKNRLIFCCIVILCFMIAGFFIIYKGTKQVQDQRIVCLAASICLNSIEIKKVDSVVIRSNKIHKYNKDGHEVVGVTVQENDRDVTYNFNCTGWMVQHLNGVCRFGFPGWYTNGNNN